MIYVPQWETTAILKLCVQVGKDPIVSESDVQHSSIDMDPNVTENDVHHRLPEHGVPSVLGHGLMEVDSKRISWLVMAKADWTLRGIMMHLIWFSQHPDETPCQRVSPGPSLC